MLKFRKKPVVIEARKWSGTRNSANELCDWINGGIKEGEMEIATYCGRLEDGGYDFLISTLEGELSVSPGDWVIKGIKGEFYPCKPDIFDATYEAVEE